MIEVENDHQSIDSVQVIYIYIYIYRRFLQDMILHTVSKIWVTIGIQ
jgi:hypothetical protein